MTSTTLALLSLTAGVFFLAGAVKGLVGLGLPTVAMALLALVMTPAQAAALLIVPSLVTNLWQIRPWSTMGPVLRRLAPMQLGVCAGTWIGAWLLGAPAGAWASISLGLALIGYGGWGLTGAKLSVSPRLETWMSPLVGAVTGFVTAATGVFAIPAVPYLQALGFERDALMQAMGISFTVSTLALAVGLYATAGHASMATGTSALMLLPALVGMQAGQLLRNKLSPVLFRKCFMGSLIALGLHMVIREFMR